jgi:hypothetical protein
MEGDAGPVSISPEQVATLVDRGVGVEYIIRLLVATGTWTEARGDRDRRDVGASLARVRLPNVGIRMVGTARGRRSAAFRRLSRAAFEGGWAG